MIARTSRLSLTLLRAPPSRTYALRAMSSSSSSNPWGESLPEGGASSLQRYLCVLPDFTDAECLSRRLSVREAHLAGAQEGKKIGRIEVGGGLLNRDWAEVDAEKGPASALGGSMLVVLGQSVEEVKQRIARDPYSTAKVWDPEKIQVHPFLQASLKK